MFKLGQIKHQKTALFFSGVLASTGFAPLYGVPVFMACLCFCFFLLDQARTYKQSALEGYLFGFGFFSAGFYWIANALLIDAATFGWLYPITLLATGACFGVFFVLPFMVWHFFKDQNVFCKVLAFSCVMVLMEYLRSFLFSGFPWNMIGSMFGFSEVLIQTASLFGTYGLSFLLLVLTGAIYALFEKKHKASFFIIFSVLSFMSIFGLWRLGVYDASSSNLKVRLVQPSIAQDMKWDRQALEENVKTYVEMSKRQGFDDVKFVVWGETATAFNPKDSVYWQKVISKAVPQNGYLMTGVLRYDETNDKLYNSMSVIDEKGETLGFYDKSHLVPFGEYIPFRAYLPSWVRPVANQIADFSVGEKYKILKVPGLPNFGALICYEIIFPDEIVNRKNKPSFVVLVSNDGWYGKSSGPYQHFLSARLRAVEEGITVVRSANNGISAVIGPLGKVLGKIGLNQVETLDVYLPQNMTQDTLYSRIGSKGIQYVMCFILLMLLVLKNKRLISQ